MFSTLDAVIAILAVLSRLGLGSAEIRAVTNNTDENYRRLLELESWLETLASSLWGSLLQEEKMMQKIFQLYDDINSIDVCMMLAIPNSAYLCIHCPQC